MTTFRYTLIAGLATVGLTLAGCSSSSNNQTTAPPVDPGPTPQEQQIADLQQQIADLRAQLGLPADANLSAGVADLQAELKRLQDEAQARMDAEQAAKDKAMAAEARKLAGGLESNPLRFPVAGDTLTVAATYGEPATVTAIFGGSDSNFMDKNSKSLPTQQGWSGTELMSTSADGSITHVMRVYTDIEPDETVPFAEWAGATTGVAWANGAVTVVPGNSALIAGAVFATASGSKTHELNVNTDADADNEVFQTPGTFGGASGTYTCAGDGTQTCTSAVASSDGGVILGGTGSPAWTFTPDNGAMAKVADSAYGHFGWWLRKADSGYQIIQFASQELGFGLTEATAVAGTATYSGPASGLYSIYDSGPKGGYFTAEVELKADFGSSTAAGTVSGMVSNFSDGAGTDPAGMDTWEVILPETPIGVGAGFGLGSPTAAQRPVWTIDGEEGVPASSTARYYGYFYAPDDGGTPQAATGGFHAEHGVIGNMTGGFGVTHSGP